MNKDSKNDFDFSKLTEQLNVSKNKSGFFDLPKENTCNDLEHNPPMHLYIPHGKGYRHICPRCGKTSTLTSPQITC